MKLVIYFYVLLIVGVLPISAQQSTATLTLSSPTLSVGESGTIEARLDCGEVRCAGFSVTLQFDPNFLQVDEIALGIYLGDNVLIPDNTIDNEKGLVHFTAVALGSLDLPEDDLLFVLEVTPLMVGTTQLQALDIEVGDMQPLVTSVRGSTVYVAVDRATATRRPTRTPRPEISITPTLILCPGTLPPRLVINETGNVLLGIPNNVRSAPTLSSQRIGNIPGGGRFTVLDGPVCADGYSWWQVNFNGMIGWTAEADHEVYWVAPR